MDRCEDLVQKTPQMQKGISVIVSLALQKFMARLSQSFDKAKNVLQILKDVLRFVERLRIDKRRNLF